MVQENESKVKVKEQRVYLFIKCIKTSDLDLAVSNLLDKLKAFWLLNFKSDLCNQMHRMCHLLDHVTNLVD